MTQELAVTPPTVHLIARNRHQMQQSQASLSSWLEQKIKACQAELAELEAVRDHAKAQHWRITNLAGPISYAKSRLLFYEKCKTAVDDGFTLVPNFPVDYFAVRVKRARPAVKDDHANYASDAVVADESPQSLPPGEGEYVSPSQVVINSTTTEKDRDGKEYTRYHQHAVEFQDPEFPIVAATPEVLDAVHEVKLMKLFDAIGICPPRRRKGDPLIIGRILLPKRGYSEQKAVSFLIAWYLDLRTL